MKIKILFIFLIYNINLSAQSYISIKSYNVFNYWEKTENWSYKDYSIQPMIDLSYKYHFQKYVFGISAGTWKQTFVKSFNYTAPPNVIYLYRYNRNIFYINPNIGIEVIKHKKISSIYKLGMSILHSPKMIVYKEASTGFNHDILHNSHWGNPISMNSTFDITYKLKSLHLGLVCKIESRIKSFNQINTQLENINDSRFFVAPGINVSYGINKNK